MNYLKMSLVGGLLLYSCAAHAVDFSKPVLDLEGKEIPVCADPKGCASAPPFTLEAVVTRALVSDYPDEQSDPRTGRPGVTGDEKFRRVELALKIKGGKDVDLKAEDITLIKSLVAKAWNPIVVHSAWEILDPAMMKDAAKH